MGDPRKTSYENTALDFDTPHYFSDFPRIQVAPQRFTQEEQFKTLNIDERQELLEKLINRVKSL